MELPLVVLVAVLDVPRELVTLVTLVTGAAVVEELLRPLTES